METLSSPATERWRPADTRSSGLFGRVRVAPDREAGQ